MKNRNSICVLIADGQYLARQSFSYLITASEKYTLAAVLTGGEEAVAFCRSHMVDIVVMDVMSGGVNGFEAAQIIKREQPWIRVILTSAAPDVGFPARARQAGAEGFLYKEQEGTSIMSVMDSVAEGKRCFPEKAPVRMLGNIGSDCLTPKELEVLRELTTGAADRDIAAALAISPATVRYHIKNLLQKTGYRCRTQLAVRARAEGIVIGDL